MAIVTLRYWAAAKAAAGVAEETVSARTLAEALAAGLAAVQRRADAGQEPAGSAADRSGAAGWGAGGSGATGWGAGGSGAAGSGAGGSGAAGFGAGGSGATGSAAAGSGRSAQDRAERLRLVLARSSFLVDGDPTGTRPPESVSLPDAAVIEVLPPFAGG